jgi:hypothetical protein
MAYLKLDSTRVSYGEYWRWKPSPVFVILAAAKALRLRLPTTLLVPAVARVDEVYPASQPSQLTAAVGWPVKACCEKGYTLALWYTLPTIGSITALGAALVGGDGRSVALAMAAQTRNGAQRELHLALVSRLAGGRMLGTTDGRSLFDPAPEIDALVLQRRPFAELIDAHDNRMRARANELVPAGDVRELIRRIEQQQVDINVARSVYVPASPEDIWRLSGGQYTSTGH